MFEPDRLGAHVNQRALFGVVIFEEVEVLIGGMGSAPFFEPMARMSSAFACSPFPLVLMAHLRRTWSVSSRPCLPATSACGVVAPGRFELDMNDRLPLE